MGIHSPVKTALQVCDQDFARKQKINASLAHFTRAFPKQLSLGIAANNEPINLGCILLNSVASYNYTAWMSISIYG